ncbi:flagellar biosynthetic protein FliO [uncultured Cohaesibacter sp.]|uniref:flagellar biosynthetic protein FliO n=1 Tax=uncultured Cohaesibacter sp. TaxID=1002546 RepID=UPI0029C712EE|nr:flagellar biosynthetic protein FliO [uncultured Cohaesibacter sp.]
MFSEEGGLLLQFLVALGIVLILILLLAWILKKVNTLSSRVGREGADPRLSVKEAIQIDHKRRLVLIRRDNVEHLVLIGGENDLLVEHHIPPLPHALQQPGPQSGPMMRPAPARPGPAEQAVAPGMVAPAAATSAMGADLKPMPPAGAPIVDAPQTPSDDMALKAAVSDLTAQPAPRPAPAAKPAPSFGDRRPPAPSAQDRPDPRMGTTYQDPMNPHPLRSQPGHSPIDPSARIDPKPEFGPRPERQQPPLNRPMPDNAPKQHAATPEGDERAKGPVEDRNVASPAKSSDAPSSRSKPSEGPQPPKPGDDGQSIPTQAAPVQPALHPTGTSTGPTTRSMEEQNEAPSVEVKPDEAPIEADQKPEAPEAPAPESYEDEINRLLNELTNDPKKA